MLRSYRRAIVAALVGIIFSSAAYSQAGPAAGSQQVDANSQGATNNKRDGASKAALQARVIERKKPIEPECGTPKECRSEQREKDDLIAQQAAAQAAVSQRDAAWWQTGIGAAGVIMLILTIIYTHRATRAAIDSVSTVIGIERGSLCINTNSVCSTDGQTTTFQMQLSNVGRTSAVLRQICLQGSKTGLFSDFVAVSPQKHNLALAPSCSDSIDKLKFPVNDSDHSYVCGYYKYSTIFSKKILTDYFCFKILPAPVDERGVVITGQVPCEFQLDGDWPPDEEWVS